MAIPKQVAKIILCEHAHQPITGNVLLLGRQTVVPTAAELSSYMGELGIPERRVEIEHDAATKAARAGAIADKSFFALFSDARVSALDVTDYEGAEIIHDMNKPIPEELKGRFDFIYNGSCLDNVFNPAQFIVNCSELLAPGGRIIHIEHASLWRSAYLMYSGDWFHDYYALNNFADCKVYYARFKWNHGNERWRMSQLQPLKKGKKAVLRNYAWVSSAWPHVIVTIAERGDASTTAKMPVQHQYRPRDDNWDTYVEAAQRFTETVRYPSGFGKATSYTLDIKRRIRSILRRPLLVTKSNLKYLQKL